MRDRRAAVVDGQSGDPVEVGRGLSVGAQPFDHRTHSLVETTRWCGEPRSLPQVDRLCRDERLGRAQHPQRLELARQLPDHERGLWRNVFDGVRDGHGVEARRRRTEPHFGDEGSAQLLHRHVARRPATDGREVAGQPRQRGIEQPRDSLKGRRREMGVRDRERIEDECECGRVEVRGRQHPPVGQDDRAVGGPCELDFDFPPSVLECLERDPDDLRQTTEGQRVLDPSSRASLEGAAFEQTPEERCRVLLPRRRSQGCDPRVEDRHVRGESLTGERGRVGREEHEARCFDERERSVRYRHRARVAQRMTVSSDELGRFEPGSRQCCSARHPVPVAPGLAAADCDRGHVSREAEIAGADRPPARDHGRHSALDHGEEEIEQRGRHACTAA